MGEDNYIKCFEQDWKEALWLHIQLDKAERADDAGMIAKYQKRIAGWLDGHRFIPAMKVMEQAEMYVSSSGDAKLNIMIVPPSWNGRGLRRFKRGEPDDR